MSSQQISTYQRNERMRANISNQHINSTQAEMMSQHIDILKAEISSQQTKDMPRRQKGQQPNSHTNPPLKFELVVLL